MFPEITMPVTTNLEPKANMFMSGRYMTCFNIFCITLLMSLSLLTWNVRGILHGVDAVRYYFSQNSDLIAIQEHWLSPDNAHRLHSFDNLELITYNCESNYNHSRGSGHSIA